MKIEEKEGYDRRGLGRLVRRKGPMYKLYFGLFFPAKKNKAWKIYLDLARYI